MINRPTNGPCPANAYQVNACQVNAFRVGRYQVGEYQVGEKAEFESIGRIKMEILTSNSKKVPTTFRWQDELKSAFRDVDSLLEFVNLKRSDLPDLGEASRSFPILVPRPFARRMQKGDPTDPLLAQVLQFKPSGMEMKPDWPADPVADKSFEKIPGLLHKYPGRVLLLLTGACAVHCRYCFRQHFDYSTTLGGISAAVEYIKSDSSIAEVILSGGDPLLKTDRALAELFQELAQIPHLRRVRIHTRTPVVIPSRVTPKLLELVSDQPQMVSFVLHINHAQEIDSEVSQMVERLRRHGTMLLNQAVLLRGVNSDLQSQIGLCEKLISLGIIPYYLHLLDRVRGAENYLVSDQEGIDLIEQLRGQLPGYGVPRLARETVGESAKSVIR